MVVRLRPHNLVAMASPSARTYEIKAADAFESKLSDRVCFTGLKSYGLPCRRCGRA